MHKPLISLAIYSKWQEINLAVTYLHVKVYDSRRHAVLCMVATVTDTLPWKQTGDFKVSCAPNHRPSKKNRKIVIMSGDDSKLSLNSFDGKSKIKKQIYVLPMIWITVSLHVSSQCMTLALRARFMNCEMPLSDKVNHISRAPSQYKDRLIYVWRFPC